MGDRGDPPAVCQGSSALQIQVRPAWASGNFLSRFPVHVSVLPAGWAPLPIGHVHLVLAPQEVSQPFPQKPPRVAERSPSFSTCLTESPGGQPGRGLPPDLSTGSPSLTPRASPSQMNESTPESEATLAPGSQGLTYCAGLIQDSLLQFQPRGQCCEILWLEAVSILPTDRRRAGHPPAEKPLSQARW